MSNRSSRNRVMAIPSADSRFLLFFLLQWSWGGLKSYSLASQCPTDCGVIGEMVKFPFAVNPVCGAPGFILNCSSDGPLWSPPDDPSLNRTFSVLEIYVHPTKLDQGSASVSLTIFPPPSHPSCSNTVHPVTNSPPFNFSSAFYNLTKEGQNWKISNRTSFLLVGCGAQNNTLIPNIQNVPCDHYNISICASKPRPPCFMTTDRESAQSFIKKCDCEYFTSFVQNGSVGNQPVLAIEWSMDQNLATQCSSCQKKNQGCVYHDTDPGKVICGECESSTCPESSSLAPGPDVSSPSQKGSKKPTVIALSVAGGSLGFVVLLLLFIVWARERKWKLQVSHIRIQRSIHKNSNLDSSGNSKLLQALVEQVGPIPSTVYSYQELRDATDAFSDSKLLGDGGFGSVYEGRLYNGQKVAVKRLYHNSYRRLEQFVNEIRILSCLQHPNLIKLYGFCYHQDPKDLLLVYEFASHGTLADHLHGGGVGKAKGLTWQMRLQVALETAVALEYLHFEVKPPIFHRDVKSANILLDDNFRAKLADFGLSRLAPPLASHVSTAPQGTPGYVDPEYHQSYQLTDKSDVYSFGVVLMELVSGKEAVDMNRDKSEINLSHLALSMIQKGAVEELIDPHLNIDRCPAIKDMARGVAELAFQCLAADKDDRPTMKQVVVELARIQRMGPWTTCPAIPGAKQLLWRNSSFEDTDVGENQQQKYPSREGKPTLPLSPTSVQTCPWNSSESPPDSMCY